MTYFTLQRIITFIVGIGILYLTFLMFNMHSIVMQVIGVLFGLIGIYIVIASLIPYKNTTKGVAEIVFDGLINLFLEILIKGLFRFIVKLFEH